MICISNPETHVLMYLVEPGYKGVILFPGVRRENKNPTKIEALASICSCRVSVGVNRQSQKGVIILSETIEFGHHER